MRLLLELELEERLSSVLLAVLHQVQLLDLAEVLEDVSDVLLVGRNSQSVGQIASQRSCCFSLL